MNISKPLGRWRIADDNPRIGSRSSVYRVVRIDDPSFVAVLKICTSSDGDAVRAFRKEIENTKSQPLPGMMPVVYDEGEDGGLPWFVMSLSEDIDLARKDADLAVRVALFLIDCAIALREKKLLHCDLKPENVGIEKGLDGEEHFVLRDWETMRDMTEANMRSGVVGTRYYRSQTVDYTGRCDERSEIHAIGKTFQALLPLVKWIVYGPVLLLAISPHIWPFVQVRTYEELRKRIVRAPGWFRRLVWLKAAVWKTSIVSRWTAAVVFGVVAVAVVMFGCHFYNDYQRRRAEVRQVRGLKNDVMALARSGIVSYRKGDFVKAYQRLKAARSSKRYDPADYEDMDVEGIYEDCQRRIVDAIRNGR